MPSPALLRDVVLDVGLVVDPVVSSTAFLVPTPSGALGGFAVVFQFYMSFFVS